MLSNVRIVLVNTSHPGNIGAVARAMKNMGLTSLWLVQPAAFPHAEATARASGADDLLAQARVCASLEEAIADCALVVGASARRRSIPWPELDPRVCAEHMLREVAAAPVALVFGREQTGLSNEELDRCQYLVHIPSNPEYPSLNLAAAVQVLAYELRYASDVPPSGEHWREHPPVSAAEMEQFYAHLERVLVALEFLDPDNPRHLMRRLRRLYHRARPDQNEINILRGILTATEACLRATRRTPNS